jgi:hypothetical protein
LYRYASVRAEDVLGQPAAADRLGAGADESGGSNCEAARQLPDGATPEGEAFWSALPEVGLCRLLQVDP